jgi:hypothetical protein
MMLGTVVFLVGLFPLDRSNVEALQQYGLAGLPVTIPASLVICTLIFTSCIGLWFMKNWARMVQIVLLLLGIVAYVALTVTGIMMFSDLIGNYLFTAIPVLAISVITLRWFLTNYSRFS